MSVDTTCAGESADCIPFQRTENLSEHGFTTPEDIQNASEAEVQQMAGIGAKLAARIDSHLSDPDANESDESDSSGLGDLFG